MPYREKNEIISEIRSICSSGKDITVAREELNTLIQELITSTGYVAGNEYPITKVKGVWRQLWTDQKYPIPSFLKMDSSKIFQIVSDQGFYWNLSNISVFGILPTIGCLRGKYEKLLNLPAVKVEFTKNGSRLFSLPKSNLFEFMSDIESGAKWILSIGSGKAPNGPVGIQGSLTSIYVDDTIRIDAGEQYDYVVSDKVVVKGFSGTLFILEKF
jgi:hypothetical protein